MDADETAETPELPPTAIEILECLYGSQTARWTDLSLHLTRKPELALLEKHGLIRVLKQAATPSVVLDDGQTIWERRDVFGITPAGCEHFERIKGWTFSAAEPKDNSQPCRHSADFTSVTWFGEQYIFSPGQQARIVRALWEAYDNGTPSLAEDTLGETVGSSATPFRVHHVFRDRNTGTTHPAFGTMIQSVGKGLFALCPSGMKKK